MDIGLPIAIGISSRRHLEKPAAPVRHPLPLILTDMKLTSLLCLILFFSCGLHRHRQKQTKENNTTESPAKLTILTWDHLHFGYTHKYVLTKNTLRITGTSNFDTTESKLYSKRVRQADEMLQFSNTKLNGLENYYMNSCVLATSGVEFTIIFETSSTLREVGLHHYYLKEVDDIIQLLNKSLPTKYKIAYLDVNTKQDCE